MRSRNRSFTFDSALRFGPWLNAASTIFSDCLTMGYRFSLCFLRTGLLRLRFGEDRYGFTAGRCNGALGGLCSRDTPLLSTSKLAEGFIRKRRSIFDNRRCSESNSASNFERVILASTRAFSLHFILIYPDARFGEKLSGYSGGVFTRSSGGGGRSVASFCDLSFFIFSSILCF